MLNISTRTGTIIFPNYLIISFKAFCILEEHALSSGQTQWLHQPGAQPDMVVVLVQVRLVVPGVQLGGEKGSYLRRMSYLLLVLLSLLLELKIKTKPKNTLD